MTRTTILSLLVYGLLMFGLATLNGSLIALTLPLVLFLIAAFVSRPETLQLSAVRTLSSEHAAQNSPVAMKLILTNEGSHIEELFIEDHVPPLLVVTDGIPTLFTTLGPGETVELRYSVSGKRGSFAFGPVRVRGSDHLDLFRRETMLSAPCRLLVLPEISRLKRVAIRPMRTRFYSGLNLSRHSGSGTDFFGVRTYQMGDPVRWLNWKMSARHQHLLFTNEFESERIADVGLILDARSQNNVRVKHDSLFNHAVRATASLAEVFLKDGNRVSLLIYGKTLQRTFPGYGKMQRERIFRALAQAEIGVSQIFSSLNYLPTRFFPAKSQLVLISSLSPKDLPNLVQLRALGYHLLIISPDPVAFESAHLHPDPNIILATRIARMERTLLLRKLRRYGIIVVNWQVDTPLEQTMLSSMSRLPHWVRAMETMV
jgi:uncharacterized protein (DUF58 family)